MVSLISHAAPSDDIAKRRYIANVLPPTLRVAADIDERLSRRPNVFRSDVSEVCCSL